MQFLNFIFSKSFFIICEKFKNINFLFLSLFLSLLGETFSENFSHTEQCQQCTQCEGLLRMETPCTDSNDAICVCNYGYFLSAISGRCEACTMCPRGQGVLLQCQPDRDTFCETCEDDTYSDRDSALDPCLPCNPCDEQLELERCSPTQDAVCLDGTGTGRPHTGEQSILCQKIIPTQLQYCAILIRRAPSVGELCSRSYNTVPS